MPDQRLWTYRANRPHAASGMDRLLAQLALHEKLPHQPVHIALADLVLDTKLSPTEAITALTELRNQGLISVFPMPRLTHSGQAMTYTVWLQQLH